jgi:hypothetical protein
VTLEEAREIVRKAYNRGEYFNLGDDPDNGSDERYVLDGHFSLKELEAMVVILRSTPNTAS